MENYNMINGQPITTWLDNHPSDPHTTHFQYNLNDFDANHPGSSNPTYNPDSHNFPHHHGVPVVDHHHTYPIHDPPGPMPHPGPFPGPEHAVCGALHG